MRFWWHDVLPIGDIDRAGRKLVDDLPQNERALSHLLDPHEVTIVTIASAADDNLEVILLVIEIWMFPPQIVFDAAPAQIRSGHGVSNGAIARNHGHVLRSINEDAVACQE